MTSLFLVLTLSAWPLPADAGRAEFAAPEGWPNEPGWQQAWPFFSWTPADWPVDARERDAGLGMQVDRAWSVTRGGVTIAVVARAVNLSDPLVAGAWRLNPGEAPDAGDRNGNGRLDVGDFVGVADVNGNGALDLDDLQHALADGVDQDQNGRVDDLCGWDFARDAAVASEPDAGLEPWRALVAPVDDGQAGIGVCPGCTVVPWVASTLDDAVLAGEVAAVVLLPHDEAELSTTTLARLDGGAVFVTPGSGTHATWPLALHPAVSSPRTLTATAERATARSRGGCGGAALGSHSVSTTTCEGEAAATLAGLAALVRTVGPSLTPAEVSGLLGGPRVDAFHAVVHAAERAGAFAPSARGVPSLATPPSAADACALDVGNGAQPIACDGGVALDGDGWFIERKGPFEWATPLFTAPLARRRWLAGLDWLAPGSGPPRYTALASGSDSVVVASIDGLRALAPSGPLAITTAREAGRLPIAVGDLDGDRRPDFVTLSQDGRLEVTSATGTPLPNFPEALDGAPAGPPVLFPALEGTALVTLTRDGALTWRLGAARWTAQLGPGQRSAPAVGFIDVDRSPDLASADGHHLRVLLTDARGPTPASWTVETRATGVLLADLVGDAALELVAEQVFDATGAVLLTLDGWTPSVVPAALSKTGADAKRALFQVERRADGAFELTRYDVEAALRSGDALAARQVLQVMTSAPSPGGFAIADVTGDRLPDVLLPTLDGVLFVVDVNGGSPAESPLPTWGTVVSAPAVGVRDGQLEFAVRTTRGDVVRWLARGLVEDLTWESAGHDPGNSSNAEVALPERHLGGLGITEPPVLPKTCGCSSLALPGLAALVFLFRRRRGTC